MNDYLSQKLRVIALILILMIVYVHSYDINFRTTGELKGFVSFIQYFFSQGIFRIPTPIFFTISGYLFFLNMKGTGEEFSSKIKKRFKTVAIPYLFWSAVGLLFYFILQLPPQLRAFFPKRIVLDYSLLEILKAIIIDPVPGQLWFLRDLMVLVILSPIIFVLVKYFRLYIVIFLMLMWFYEFNFFVVSSRGLFFFSLGAFLSTSKALLYLPEKYTNALIYILLWFFMFLFKTTLIYLNYIYWPVLEIIHKIGIFVGIWAIWNYYDYLISKEKLPTDLLSKLLPFTFFIYVFHEPLLTMVREFLQYLLGTRPPIYLTIYFAAPLLVIFMSVLTAKLTKHYFPKFYGIITGAR